MPATCLAVHRDRQLQDLLDQQLRLHSLHPVLWHPDQWHMQGEHCLMVVVGRLPTAATCCTNQLASCMSWLPRAVCSDRNGLR